MRVPGRERRSASEAGGACVAFVRVEGEKPLQRSGKSAKLAAMEARSASFAARIAVGFRDGRGLRGLWNATCTRRTSVGVILVLIGSLALVGCARGLCEECAKDSDCSMGLSCTSGWVCKRPSDPRLLCPNDCRATDECRDQGKCTVMSSRCTAASDLECRRTASCVLRGQCSARNGSCVPVTDDDCKLSEICKVSGLCGYHNGACVTTPDSCRNHENWRAECQRLGKCSPAFSGCAALSAADCADTPSCKHDGQCTPHDGECMYGSDADCQKSWKCVSDGSCSFRQFGTLNSGETCGPSREDDCRRSKGCKEFGDCHLILSAESKCGPTSQADCDQSRVCSLIRAGDPNRRSEPCKYSPAYNRCL